MSFQRQGAVTLDYQPVSYAGSTLRYRGPAVDTTRAHVLCLGGAETFGRFVPAPFPTLLGQRLDLPVANLGIAGGGLDVIFQDAAIQGAMRHATSIVLQVPGAHSLSNRFFSVHPRRNDRFVRAAGILRTIYRDVDFTEFHFTRHLLSHLKALSADRFAILRDEMQGAWCHRMRSFLTDAPVPVHLLWLSRRRPGASEPVDGLGQDPLFVTQKMLQEVAEDAASLSIVPVVDDSGGVATRGMFFSAEETEAARALPGPSAHDAACNAILAQLRMP